MRGARPSRKSRRRHTDADEPSLLQLDSSPRLPLHGGRGGYVGQPLAGSASKPDRITDAAISSNGAWVVLRTLQSLTFYRGDEFLRGNFEEQSRVDLSSLREPQGEAVAFGTDGTLFVAGEGGGKGQPGTLGVLSCRF